MKLFVSLAGAIVAGQSLAAQLHGQEAPAAAAQDVAGDATITEEILAIAEIARSAADVAAGFNLAFRPRWDVVKGTLPAATKLALRTWFTERIVAGAEVEQQVFVGLFRVALDAATAAAGDSIERVDDDARELVALLFDHQDHATVPAKLALLVLLEQETWGVVSDEVRQLLPRYVVYAFQTQQLDVVAQLLRDDGFRCRDALALRAREEALRQRKSDFAIAVIDQFGPLLGLSNGRPAVAEAELTAELLALLADSNVSSAALPAAFNRLIRPRREQVAPVLSAATSAALRDWFLRHIAAGDSAEGERFLQLFELARDAGASVVDLVAVLADTPDLATAGLKINLLAAIDQRTFGDLPDVIDVAVAGYACYAVDRQQLPLLEQLVTEGRFRTHARIARRVREALLSAEAAHPNFAEAAKERVGSRVGLKSQRQLAEEARVAAENERMDQERIAELARRLEMQQLQAEREAEMLRVAAQRETDRRAQVEDAFAQLPAALASFDRSRVARCLAGLALANTDEHAAARTTLRESAVAALSKAIAACPDVANLSEAVTRIEELTALAPLDRELAIAATRPLLGRVRTLPDEDAVASLDRITTLLTRLQNRAGSQGLLRLIEPDLALKRTRVAARRLVVAVESCVAARGRPPTTLDELLPSGAAPGYVADRAALWDPWRRPFTLEITGGAIAIRSAGPNGVAGDGDDVVAASTAR